MPVGLQGMRQGIGKEGRDRRTAETLVRRLDPIVAIRTHELMPVCPGVTSQMVPQLRGEAHRERWDELLPLNEQSR